MYDITFVIPTKGRPTLERCLESFRPSNQSGYKADVLVVYDDFGDEPYGYYTKQQVKDLCVLHNVRFDSCNAGYSNWGYDQLEYGYRLSGNNDFLTNLGDDDVMEPEVIPQMLEIINRHGLQPYLFQAILYPSPHRGNVSPVLLWNDESRDIERKSITGQNFVVPNIPRLFGPITDDFIFMRDTIGKWYGLVRWVSLPTCRCF